MEYKVLKLDWTPEHQWMLPPEHAANLLKKWTKQVPERVEKLLRLLEAEGFTSSGGIFTSVQLPVLEKFIFKHCNSVFDQRKKKIYLDLFTFEICKDDAALIGALCQDQNPEQIWVL